MIGLGVALMVTPRSCLGTAVTVPGTAKVPRTVSSDPSMAKRRLIEASFPSFVGMPPPDPGSHRAVADDTHTNTAKVGKDAAEGNDTSGALREHRSAIDCRRSSAQLDFERGGSVCRRAAGCPSRWDPVGLASR
jgi:hypothetical protein